MKLRLTKSKVSGDGYISTLTDRGESLVCKPVGGADYDSIIEEMKLNPNIYFEPFSHKEITDFEDCYDVYDKQIKS